MSEDLRAIVSRRNSEITALQERVKELENALRWAKDSVSPMQGQTMGIINNALASLPPSPSDSTAKACPSRREGWLCVRGAGHDRGVCVHCGQEWPAPPTPSQSQSEPTKGGEEKL